MTERSPEEAQLLRTYLAHWATSSNPEKVAKYTAEFESAMTAIKNQAKAEAGDTLAAALGRLERLDAGINRGPYIVTEETLDEDVWVREELRLLRDVVGLGYLPDLREARHIMRAYAALVSSPSVEATSGVVLTSLDAMREEAIIREVIDWYEQQGASKPFDLTQRDAREHFGVTS